MILKNGDSLRVNLPTSPNIQYSLTWCDHTDDAGTDDRALGTETTAGERTILSGPGTSTQRQVRALTLINAGSAQATLWVGQHDGTVTRRLSPEIDLRAGESLVYSDSGNTWTVYTVGGAPRGPVGRTVLHTYSVSYLKVGGTMEATGILHTHALSAGSPGAWAPGSPGLAGRATDGTGTDDLGCLPIRTPPTGRAHLTRFTVTGGVAHYASLWDFLWVNSGIAPTTTTAQTITSAAFAPRDLDGTANGRGVQIALMVSTATTNGAAVTTITVSYTNSAGVSGRTGTIPSFPATAQAGTIVPILLQSGDQGVRSIESITLGTSLAGGAVHLIAYTILVEQPVALSNAGTGTLALSDPGLALEAGVCALPVILTTATTATTIYGTIQISEVV
jgi:hypothetical protein